MFRPNQTCRLQLSNGHDIYGQPKPATVVREGCAIVKLVQTATKTSVRADSSASRGNAEEVQAQSVILLPPSTRARIGDLIDVAGVQLKIESTLPRHDCQGRFDHVEITASIWRLS